MVRIISRCVIIKNNNNCLTWWWWSMIWLFTKTKMYNWERWCVKWVRRFKVPAKANQPTIIHQGTRLYICIPVIKVDSADPLYLSNQLPLYAKALVCIYLYTCHKGRLCWSTLFILSTTIITIQLQNDNTWITVFHYGSYEYWITH